jgi:hypothetical protein
MSHHDELCEYYAPVLAQLENLNWQPNGNAAANCPAHDDCTRSLSVKFGRQDELLVKCHADQGCTFLAIAGALQRFSKDFFRHAAGNDRPTESFVEAYDYTNVEGEVTYQSMRFFPKRFQMRRPDPERPGSWINNMDGVVRVPYRLSEIASSSKDRTVFVVEGETKVHCLEDLGFLATCNAGGSEKWQLDWLPYFLGRPLAILPDHDEKGWRHAAVVAKCLVGTAAPLRIVELPGLKLKDDVLNWRKRMPENRGVVAEAIKAAVLCAPPYDPANDPQMKLAILRMEIARAMAMSGGI